MDCLETIGAGLTRSLYRVLAPLLVPVRKEEENSICCFLQEEEEEKAAQERLENFHLCLFVPGSRVNSICLSLTKEERWELFKVMFFKKSLREACGELWVEITGG